MFNGYDSVRRPRSQAVVDMARKFGRIYAYSESDMHQKPEEMRRFFKEASAYTNNADLMEQNERAMAMFRKGVESATNGTNGYMPSLSTG